MSRSVVPRSSLQTELVKTDYRLLTPDPHALLEQMCRIVQVYDSEAIQDVAGNEKLVNLVRHNPGVLYALVELPRGRQYILPFGDTAELIFSTYGNAPMLNGRWAKIVYRNMNIEGGRLYIERDKSKMSIAANKLSEVFDIGDII